MARDAIVPDASRDGGTRQRTPLLRGLRALELLEERPRSVAEIAAELSVNRSSAHRLLQELASASYVVHDESTHRYRLSLTRALPSRRATAFDLTHAGSDWGEQLRVALGEIRDLVGEATMFAVPAADRMLYAAFFPTEHPIGVQESIGSTRPMHASAVGKAYLSALSPAALDILLGRLKYDDGTDRAARGPFQLRDMLGAVREHGYAVDHDETVVGLSCVAAPVFAAGAVLVGATGITGPTHRFTDEIVTYYGSLLVERVRAFSKEYEDDATSE
jgi:IclR family acetate operon transcriptional repressor